jgi:hypothetical protein
MVLADTIDTLSRVGAIGGILAIIGTGLLILLVAAQNRQIRSMKDWIDAEPERQQEITQRVVAEVQRRIADARARRAGVAPPAAPAALPDPKTPAAVAAAAAGLAGGTAAKSAAGSTAPPAIAPPGTPGAPKFAPLTPAGGDDSTSVPAPGSDEELSADLGDDPGLNPAEDELPAVVAGFNSQSTQLSDTLPPQDTGRPSASASSMRVQDVRFDDDEYEPEEEEHRSNKWLFGIGFVALLAGIVLLATMLFGGDEPSTPASSDNTPAETAASDGSSKTTPKKSTNTTPNPSTVSVRVLNGTTVAGLAQKISLQVKNEGYAVGPPETLTSSQVLTNSVVYYRPNFRPSAEKIADSLGLGTDSVQPIDAETSVAAGDNTEVVITAGTDLSTGSSGTTGTTG